MLKYITIYRAIKMVLGWLEPQRPDLYEERRIPLRTPNELSIHRIDISVPKRANLLLHGRRTALS